MKINLNILPKYFDEDVEIPNSFYENTDIKKIDKVHIKGDIKYNLSDEVEISLNVLTNITLQDSITLENILYPISIDIQENLEEIEAESTNFYEKDKNILDIIEFLWENIVLEVPISLTSVSGTNLKGDGWELNKLEEDEEIDNQFLKLNDVFKGGE